MEINVNILCFATLRSEKSLLECLQNRIMNLIKQAVAVFMKLIIGIFLKITILNVYYFCYEFIKLTLIKTGRSLF